jgi:hypothetical protein
MVVIENRGLPNQFLNSELLQVIEDLRMLNALIQNFIDIRQELAGVNRKGQGKLTETLKYSLLHFPLLLPCLRI